MHAENGGRLAGKKSPAGQGKLADQGVFRQSFGRGGGRCAERAGGRTCAGPVCGKSRAWEPGSNAGADDPGLSAFSSADPQAEAVRTGTLWPGRPGGRGPSPGRGFIRLRRVSKRILGSAGLEKWASSPACRLRRTSSSKALAARAMRGTVPASCQPGLLRANLARIVPEEDGMEAVDRRGPAAQARKTLPAWRRRAPKRVLFSERYATAQRVQSMTAAAMAGKMPMCRQRRRPPAGARRESPGRCPRRRRPAPRKESGGSWRGRGCLSRSPCSAARSC